MSDPIVTVTVTRSAGMDGALLVLIDTTEHFQEGSRPLRILLNDDAVFADVEYDHAEETREAREVTLDVYADQVAYPPVFYGKPIDTPTGHVWRGYTQA